MRKIVFLLLCILTASSQLFAQGKTVTGKVTDENGNPLSGASISAVGSKSNANAMSDGSGNFSITLPSSVKQLSISYVGFTTSTVTLTSGQTSMSVKLAPGAKLDEVVVTGINRVKRSQYTGAASKISEAQIANRPVGSFDQLFQGRVPGVLALTSSGQPGAATNIIIRGSGSIDGGSDPLYIMDGIPVEGGVFQSINPNDFESIDILRDASATALYGSRASSGVIVVTTKKGKSGDKMRVTYTGQAGVKNRPTFTWDMLTSAELLKTQEMYGKVRNITNTTAIKDNMPGWYYSSLNPEFQTVSATEQAARTKSLDSISQINTDWRDVFLKKGGFNSHQISLSGGTGKTRIFTSLSLYNEEGTTLRTDMKRGTWRTNVDYADDKFSLSLQTNLGYTKRNFQQSTTTNSLGNPFLVMNLNVPYTTLYNTSGLINTNQGTKYAATRSYELTSLDVNKSDQIKAVIGTTASYKITEDLSVGVTTGLDFRQTLSTNYGSRLAFTRRTSTSITGKAGFQSETTNTYFSADIRPSLEYRKTFSQKHDISAAVYGEYINEIAKQTNFTGYGIDPRTPNTPAAITTSNALNQLFPVIGGFKSKNTLFSGLLNTRYTYDGKYTLTASYRRDASSKLPEVNRWTGFYAIGLLWDATKESFLRGNTKVNTMRVRFSYGGAGNSINFPRGDYPYQSTYGANGTYGSLITQQATYPGNDNLKWETTFTTNVGVDFGFFRNRIYGTFDWYNKVTKDLFVQQTLVPQSPFGSLSINGGQLQNKGIEVGLSAEVVRTRELTWTINGNFALNRNKVLDLGGQPSYEQGTEQITIGLPLGSHFEVKWGGVDAASGAPLYYDANGKLTSVYAQGAPVQQFGTWEAPWKGGFGTSLRYKGIEISTQFSWQKGANKVNNLEYFMENPRGFIESGYNQANTLKFWQQPGDIVNTPSPAYGVDFSSKLIQNADFLRWRDLTVSYTIPQNLVKKVKFISNINCFIQGQNLAIWTKWKGMDPEAGATNINLSEFPNPKAITGGVTITF